MSPKVQNGFRNTVGPDHCGVSRPGDNVADSSSAENYDCRVAPIRASRKEILYAAFICLLPCFIPASHCSHLFLTTNQHPPVLHFRGLFLSQHAVVESGSAWIRW